MAGSNQNFDLIKVNEHPQTNELHVVSSIEGTSTNSLRTTLGVVHTIYK